MIELRGRVISWGKRHMAQVRVDHGAYAGTYHCKRVGTIAGRPVFETCPSKKTGDSYRILTDAKN